MLWAVLLVTVGVVNAFQAPLALRTKRYDGYKVYNIVPATREAVDLLHHLMLTDINLDFWQEPSNVGAEVHMMVPPPEQERIEAILNGASIAFSMHIDDVQNLLTPMWNDIDRRSLTKMVYDENEFNTLDDINTWLEGLVSKCAVGLTCELYSIGKSSEGRDINVFKISKSGVDRKAYWIDATIHAREWLATATVTNILGALALGNLTEKYDWYILPVMNPDGYAYTWTKDRLWRKNRRLNDGPSECYGTDLNRNFDFRWGNDGVSHLPCADTYCGPSAGSEPETQAVSAELKRLGSTLSATVTVHSYGNMWMFPWGNTVNYAGRVCDLADDHNDMMLVAQATTDAIEATYNTDWAPGNSCQVIYATTGGTDDYAKGVAGIKYAFCPELRGNNFVVASSQIALSFKEVWNGIVAMTTAIDQAAAV